MGSAQTDEAPGRLDLLRRLVNTWDYPNGPDRLSDPESASQWTGENGLAPLTNQAECEKLREFREVVRDLLFANNGEADSEKAWRELEPFTNAVQLRVAFDPVRGPQLYPQGSGVDGAIATMLAVIYEAVQSGNWDRLRACRKDTCKMAYYDHSKNASRAWCSMAVCGNREKATRRRRRDSAL